MPKPPKPPFVQMNLFEQNSEEGALPNSEDGVPVYSPSSTPGGSDTTVSLQPIGSKPRLDIEKWRRQPPGGNGPTRRVITSVQLRKPKNGEFVRRNPHEEGFVTELLDLGSDGLYFVEPRIAAQAQLQLKSFTLHPVVNRDGVFFFWVTRNSAAGATPNSWNDSAETCVELSKTCWVRVSSNRDTKSYDCHEAHSSELPGPVWPSESIPQLLELAIAPRLIEDLEHPLVRRLMGLV